ncbi:adenylosuccinate synthetase [bacterium]|nr:adenylosuccinate synthetase [bacterium]
MRRAVVLVDLGFGDAGKGTVVDFLVRRHEARAVVRFNGGAQAGHNVVLPDGRHHTFSQIGAGGFVPGVRTLLSRFFVLHPTALLVEARHLAAKGVPDPLALVRASERALVVTPYHQAAARLRELSRGASRHGSCGVGTGEAVSDSLGFPEDAVRAGDLGDRRALATKLERTRERKLAELSLVLDDLAGDPLAAPERRALEDREIAGAWTLAVREIHSRVVAPEPEIGSLLAREGTVVFEGAHGTLLDEWRGFHPFTTWSTCTSENALALLTENDLSGEIHRIGVLRTYATRHGPGPFPSESSELASAFAEPHNPSGTWQGAFRVGWPDLVLARYALAANGGVDGLALTHEDALERVSEWRACASYRAREIDERLFESSPDSPGAISGIRLGASGNLARQEALARALSSVEPAFVPLPLARERGERARSYREWLSSSLGLPVWLASNGPTAADKVWLGPARVTGGAAFV